MIAFIEAASSDKLILLLKKNMARALLKVAKIEISLAASREYSQPIKFETAMINQLNSGGRQ